MKTISDYRTQMLTLLGDSGGRRYTEAILDTGLRQALDRMQRTHPHRETVNVRIASIDHRDAILNWTPPAAADILSVRTAAGKLLKAAVIRTGMKTFLKIFSRNLPNEGDPLTIELGLPHTVRGLDDAQQTTVPDPLLMTLCTGAAGYAMRIRARSVTEVFGKRPEDTERLIEQAELLIRHFEDELNEKSFAQALNRDPWPKSGFPI